MNIYMNIFSILNVQYYYKKKLMDKIPLKNWKKYRIFDFILSKIFNTKSMTPYFQFIISTSTNLHEPPRMPENFRIEWIFPQNDTQKRRNISIQK